MKPDPGGFSILLLSEDSAKDSHETLRWLVLHMLALVDPAFRERQVKFEPEDRSREHIVHANLWKSKNPRDHQGVVDLVRHVGTMLVLGKFVFWHADGDQVWAKRKMSDTENRFLKIIVSRVKLLLPALATPVKDGRVDAGECMQRLVLIMPFYSIEAWLYQNTKAAVAICRREHNRGQHVEQLAHWEAHRDKLDEVEQVKDKVCLGAKYNLELAANEFPAEAVYDVRKSFAAAVEKLRQCASLAAALARSHRAAGSTPATPGATVTP